MKHPITVSIPQAGFIYLKEAEAHLVFCKDKVSIPQAGFIYLKVVDTTISKL